MYVYIKNHFAEEERFNRKLKHVCNNSYENENFNT